MLLYENTRAFCIVWVIFNDNRIFYTFNYIAHHDAVRRNFIVSMSRHPYFAFAHQLLHRI